MTTYDDFHEPSELDTPVEGETDTRAVMTAAGHLAHASDHGIVKPGWYCSRERGHDGPCAAWPIGHSDEFTFPNEPILPPDEPLPAGFSIVVGVFLFLLFAAVIATLCGA